MEDLVVKSTSIVHPINIANQSISSDRVKKKINLTPWDLIRLRFSYPQRGLFFHKPDDSDIDTVISKLKTSLSIALHHFYPLAGRLVKQVNGDDNTVSYFISCCCDDDGSGSGGVKFIHAAAETVAISDLAKSRFVGSSFFFPATGIKNYQGVSNPLLMIQVTELKDGMFISYGYNHTVADGKSIWKFINAWSQVCSKGFGSVPVDLYLKGWFLDRVKYPIRVPDPETGQPSHGALTTSNTLQEIVFRLTKENVLKLKAKANEQAESREDGEISSFQAVLGHIWRSRVKHGGMSREEETHCRVPIDMRQRLNKPKLKEDCFGNLVHTGIVTVKVGEMLDHGLGWLAEKINDMVRSQTDESVKAFGEDWVKNVEIPVTIGPTLFVASSPRFDVYGNDFGWGKPIGLLSGPPHISGKLVAIQGVVEEGGLEFQACFPCQVVVKLLCDDEFLEYVDIIAS